MDIELLRQMATMDAINDTDAKPSGQIRWTNADTAVDRALSLLATYEEGENPYVAIDEVYDAIKAAYVLPDGDENEEADQ